MHMFGKVLKTPVGVEQPSSYELWTLCTEVFETLRKVASYEYKNLIT